MIDPSGPSVDGTDEQDNNNIKRGTKSTLFAHTAFPVYKLTALNTPCTYLYTNSKSPSTFFSPSSPSPPWATFEYFEPCFTLFSGMPVTTIDLNNT